jgi:hypothetical protein
MRKHEATRRFRVAAAILLVVATMVPGLVLAASYTITAEDWARPRSGERVAQLPALRGLASEIEQHPHVRILVRYAGGDDGLLWAEELRGWLVALGISGRRIQLRPGLESDDRIVVKTELPGDR